MALERLLYGFGRVLRSATPSFPWLEDARRDLSYAVRMLRRSPIVAATAILSLAIGIGANTAIFTVANALLLRGPVGVARADRLVDIGVSRTDGGFNPASFPTYQDVRERAKSFDGVYAFQMFPHELSLGVAGRSGAPDRVYGHFVTLNYFTVLGVVPRLGRLFGPSDAEAPGASPFVVLSHRYWSRILNSDAAAVGRTLRLNGQPFIVIGIAPDGFHGTGVAAADVWVPLGMLSAVTGQAEVVFRNRERGWLVMGARLKPGISAAAAGVELDVLAQRLALEYPSGTTTNGLRVLPSSSVPGNRAMIAVFVGLLTGMVGIVLLVACANVSGILLARGSARQREVAVRLSLGADRSRLVRQLITETTLLFALGGAAGVALAQGLTSVLVSRLPSLPFPIALSLTLDGRVVAFTTGLALVAALATGLVPALQTSKTQPIVALKEGSSGSPARSRLRHAFVITQVALSVALVVGAGLFARALVRAGEIDPGFDAGGIELTSVDVSVAGYTDTTGPAFWHSLLDRVRTLQGVQNATLARVVPGGFEGIGLGLGVPGGSSSDDDVEPDGNIIETGYFATLRIPFVAGRDFTADDRAGGQPVVIVGEAAARHFWPGENAIGKYLSQRVEGGTRSFLVVGVVRDIKSTSLVDGMSQSFVYLPLQQSYAAHLTSSMTIVARGREGQSVASSIRDLVASMDPNLPQTLSRTLDESVALGLVPQRVAASLAGSLGIVGLLLAAIGIYGVTAFAVARRLREFGIRIALGARRDDIFRIVLQQGIGLVSSGCVLGVILATAIAHVLSGFLLGVPALDPAILAGAVALFLSVGLAACYGPARRATNVDPLTTLRCD
jgi:putative ABC transport system permease protein